MRKFFARVFNLLVISFILAVALWYYAVGVQGPIITRSFKVQVTPINLANGVYITNEIGDVTVKAEGSSKVILGINASDFTALVNLAGKEEGEYLVPVEVRPPSSSIKIKSVSPAKVKVSLEKISTMKLPIIVKFTGKPDPNFVPANPILTPTEVTLTGPMSRLRNIKSVYVEVNLTGVSKPSTFVLPVMLSVKDDASVDSVQVNPSSCVVKLPGKNPIITKTVPVVPDISGVPFEGFAVKSVTVDPSVVTLQGSFSDLNGVSSVSTVPIDINGITESKKYTVKFTLPDDVEASNRKTECTVSVSVVPLKKEALEVPLTVNYDSVKYDVSVSVQTVSVILYGFPDELKSITGSTVSALVDVSNFTEGEYDVPVTVRGLPKGSVIATIVPRTVHLKITKKEATP